MELPNLLDEDPLGFWPRLATARHPLLGLDYDGTLAPFQVDRMAAVPFEGVVEALRALVDSGSTRVVIISGRLAAEVVELLGEVGVTTVGSHGYEVRHPDGRLERTPLEPAQTRALGHSEELVGQLGLAERLERKAASLAFHTRGLDLQQARSLELEVWRRWSPAAQQSGMLCTHFDGGVELRARGIDKGSVLAALLEQESADLAVHIGDDQTDEDAFAMLRQRGGVGIKVGPGETAASARLPGCRQVLQFLRRWHRTLWATQQS